MAHETLADIEQEQRTRVARARRYTELKTIYVDNLRLSERLEAPSPLEKQKAALLRVLEASNKLSDEVVHDSISMGFGGVAIPGGISKSVLVAVASNALARIERRLQDRAADLEVARQRRDEAKNALAEEFNE